MIPRWLPGNLQEVKDALILVLAGWASWAVHPTLWVVAGPFRWAALLLATAAQESGYNRNAVGDDGASVGLLQFYAPTWESLGAGDLDNRFLPSRQGWYAGKYVQGALLEDARWFLVAVPVYGFAVLRFLWTSGPGQADRILSTALSRTDTESNAWPAFWFWRIVWLVPALIVARWVYTRPVKQ